MKNVLLFQTYLSNRKLSSNTVERQFRFLQKEPDTKVYVLLGEDESEYAKYLENNTTLIPALVDYLEDNVNAAIDNLIEKYDFESLYIARTYFTPCTQEIIDGFKNLTLEKDNRYWRNTVPIRFASYGRPVHHIIYDPLEMQYDELIDERFYDKFSSMNNVEGAKPHSYADLGYYDKGVEVATNDKEFKFTFGGTAMSAEREALIQTLYNDMHELWTVNLFVRTSTTNNLVDNSVYEDLTSKSLFTYTIPSQCDKYMSFTRMLLALSQGTIPLIHPDNNLDCLFGEGFEFRDSLREFFEKLIMSPEELVQFIKYHSIVNLQMFHRGFIEHWKNTEYYQWLQKNCI